MLFPWAMVALAIILVQRRVAARWIVLGALATMFVCPISEFVRRDILLENTVSAAEPLRNPVATLSRVGRFMSGSRPGDYFVEGISNVVARMDHIGAASVLIRNTPSRAPFLHGKTLGLFFVAFVPRFIWPDKPTITIGRFITNTYGSGPDVESDTAPTMLGELFINFGYPGIIRGMLIYVIVLRIAHESLLVRRPTTPALLVAVAVLLNLSLGFQGGIANNWAVTV